MTVLDVLFAKGMHIKHCCAVMIIGNLLKSAKLMEHL